MDESWLKSLEHGGIKSILWQEFFSCKKRTLHRQFVKKLEGLFSGRRNLHYYLLLSDELCRKQFHFGFTS